MLPGALGRCRFPALLDRPNRSYDRRNSAARQCRRPANAELYFRQPRPGRLAGRSRSAVGTFGATGAAVRVRPARNPGRAAVAWPPEAGSVLE